MAALYRSPHQIEIDGIQMPGHWTSQQRFDQLKCMTTTDKDIILAAYPRCGSTWMLEILYLLQTRGDFDGARAKHMSARRMFIDLTVVERQGGNTTDAYTKAQTLLGQNRLMKTHACSFQLHKPVQDEKAKIVVILRNPKDALVSYYDFYCKNKPYAQQFDHGWEHFFEMAMAKQVMFGDWLEFYLSYWKLRHKKNIHFVIYEEAIKDTKRTIKELANFLDIAIEESLMNDIYEYTTFESMKSNKTVNIPHMEGVFVRQGKVGAWKHSFTVSQSERLDDLYGDAIRANNVPVMYSAE